MDNITHSLVGALLGQAGLKRKTGLAMPALVIGANLPDIDAACFFWLDGVQHLAVRRGITHGPIALVLLPLLLAGILYGFDRWQSGRQKRPEYRLPVRFAWLLILSGIACLTHPALDWLNVYGIRLLEPFSSEWFYGDTLFIIDWVLWLMLGYGTWRSLRQERRNGEWRRTGQWALTGASVYILANGLLTSAALRSWDTLSPAPTAIIASPAALQPWKRELLYTDQSLRWYRADWTPFGLEDSLQLAPGQCAVAVEALPADANLAAFLFWSRAPLFEPGPGGNLLVRDARFSDPRARDRFTVRLPGVKCEEPPSP